MKSQNRFPCLIVLAGLAAIAGSAGLFVWSWQRAGHVEVDDSGPYRGIVFVASKSVDSEPARRRILLAGSMHKLRWEDYPLPESYSKALAEADVVVFELDQDEGATDADSILRQSLTYGDVSQLRDHVSSGTYDRLAALCEDREIDLGMLGSLRAHAAAQVISSSNLLKAGFEKKWGVDNWLRGQSRDRGLRVQGLESLEEQLSVFADMDDERQEALLLDAIQSLEDDPRFGLHAYQAWRSGDVSGIAALRDRSKGIDAQLENALFGDRHEVWMGKIEAMAEPGKTLLVVVGAAHLCGHGSLVDLLRDKGWAVDQW